MSPASDSPEKAWVSLLGLGFLGEGDHPSGFPRKKNLWRASVSSDLEEACASCSTTYQVRSAEEPPGPGWAKKGGYKEPRGWRGRGKASIAKWAARGRRGNRAVGIG